MSATRHQLEYMPPSKSLFIDMSFATGLGTKKSSGELGADDDRAHQPVLLESPILPKLSKIKRDRPLSALSVKAVLCEKA